MRSPGVSPSGSFTTDWSELKVPLVFPEELPNLASLASIRITDSTLISRAADEGVAAAVRRLNWLGASGRRQLTTKWREAATELDTVKSDTAANRADWPGKGCPRDLAIARGAPGLHATGAAIRIFLH